ncbi:hypothetical protein MRX96_028867 [Rhipicephalus microplus]
MEECGCDFVEGENTEVIASSRPQTLQSGNLQQRLGSSTLSETQPFSRNGNHCQEIGVMAQGQQENSPNGSLFLNENDAVPSAQRASFVVSPKRTDLPSQDRDYQEKAHGAARAALCPSNFRPILVLRPIWNLLRHIYTYLAENLAHMTSAEEILFCARPSRSSKKMVTRDESPEGLLATIGTAYSARSTSVEQPESSSDSFDSSSSGAEEEERGTERNVGGSYRVLRHTRREAQGPSETTGPMATVIETAVHLTAVERRIRLVQREEAPIRVHAPRYLNVSTQEPCYLEVSPADQGAVGSAAGATEDPRHFAEWETFTRALLTLHRCIHHLQLHISAVTRLPGHFYQTLSLQEGTALIKIEVSAFEDPCMDFMLPYLQYLCRVRNAHMTSIYVQRKRAPHPDDVPNEVYASVIVGEGLPELGDIRFSRLLDWTMDMAFLRRISICVHNTGTRPSSPHEISLNLTHVGHCEPWSLTYEVDESLQTLLHCNSDNIHGVSTTVTMGSAVLLPGQHTLRELRGSADHLLCHLITLAHDSSPYHYIINVASYVRMRDDEGVNLPLQ